MSSPFRIEPLAEKRSRADFRSGESSLDRYFAERVTQDIRRLVATCFIAVERETERIAGYYTLAAAAVALEDWPVEVVRRLPRYPSIPAVLIGRLAVDRDFQQRGLGAALLADALQRAATSDIAAFAAIVDAINDDAVDFYRKHGFIAFEDRPRQLFLPFAALPKRQ